VIFQNEWIFVAHFPMADESVRPHYGSAFQRNAKRGLGHRSLRISAEPQSDSGRFSGSQPKAFGCVVAFNEYFAINAIETSKFVP
jgi:hypothetical protein